MGGGQVGGQEYSAQECFMQACEKDPCDFRAWANLGYEGGGHVGGWEFSEKECLRMADTLEMQQKQVQAQGKELQENPFTREELEKASLADIRAQTKNEVAKWEELEARKKELDDALRKR